MPQSSQRDPDKKSIVETLKSGEPLTSGPGSERPEGRVSEVRGRAEGDGGVAATRTLVSSDASPPEGGAAEARFRDLHAALGSLQELEAAPRSLRSQRFGHAPADAAPGSSRMPTSSDAETPRLEPASSELASTLRRAVPVADPSSSQRQVRGIHLDADADGSLPSFDLAETIDHVAAHELPPGVLRDGVRRLGQSALMHVGLLITLLALGALLADRSSRLWLDHYPGYLPPLLAAVAINLGLFGLTRLPRVAPRSVVRAGFAYLVLYSLTLAMFRHSHPWGPDDLLRSWAPSAVAIVLFGALVPLRPGSVLLVGLVAAAMDPLAARLYGVGSTSLASSLMLASSPVLAAGLAFFASSVTHDLTQRIKRERDVGAYTLLERLGSGAMGEVWRAEHRMLARGAAIKLIKPKALCLDSIEEARRVVRLFELEAQATTMLTSPHTIDVYDFGVTHDGHFYYAMELLDGFDLQTLVERHGPQNPARVAHVLHQVADSLAEAHGHAYVHRDLKPANVFLCHYGGRFDFVKVLDFGLVLDASRAQAEVAAGEESEPRLIGTPSIMAPEMLVPDARVDHRSDLYALGCLGYWLLTGERVFPAETRLDMMRRHATALPVPPSERCARSIPDALEDLIMACLQKNPAQRPQSARAVAEALEATGLLRLWSEERARDFWDRHATGPVSSRLTG